MCWNSRHWNCCDACNEQPWQRGRQIIKKMASGYALGTAVYTALSTASSPFKRCRFNDWMDYTARCIRQWMRERDRKKKARILLTFRQTLSRRAGEKTWDRSRHLRISRRDFTITAGKSTERQFINCAIELFCRDMKSRLLNRLAESWNRDFQVVC